MGPPPKIRAGRLFIRLAHNKACVIRDLLEIGMSIDTYAQLDRHFQGYARINLDNVKFDSGRDLEDRNVKRLVGIFQLQGCERRNTANAISVLVERKTLENVLPQQSSPTSTSYSITPGQLPHLDTKVRCLQGKHRIHAARKVLRGLDRWWPAKVFDTGKASHLKAGAYTNDVNRPSSVRSRAYSS